MRARRENLARVNMFVLPLDSLLVAFFVGVLGREVNGALPAVSAGLVFFFLPLPLLWGQFLRMCHISPQPKQISCSGVVVVIDKPRPAMPCLDPL